MNISYDIVVHSTMQDSLEDYSLLQLTSQTPFRKREVTCLARMRTVVKGVGLIIIREWPRRPCGKIKMAKRSRESESESEVLEAKRFGFGEGTSHESDVSVRIEGSCSYVIY